MSTRITSGTPWLLSLGVLVAIRAVVIDSDEKLINSIDFKVFGIVLVSSGLTMDDSLLSLDVLCTTWLVFGLS